MKTLFFLMILTTNLAKAQAVPFDPERATLYSNTELSAVDHASGDTLDARIYKYLNEAEKFAPSRKRILMQRSHDAGIEKAMNSLLKLDSTGRSERRVISMLGSHSKNRDDIWYKQAARLALKLSTSGYYVVSGGGAGLMEAVHLGTYLATYCNKYGENCERYLEDALEILAQTPRPPTGVKQFELTEFGTIANKVIQKYPKGEGTLGIPVWFMPHEPGNAFNGPVAKFLSNAIREEKLTSIGVEGAIFLPGGPGTMKEVFMVASNNNYKVYHYYSPMIFFNDPVNSVAPRMNKLVLETATSYAKKDMMVVSDSIEAVLEFLIKHPPVNQ